MGAVPCSLHPAVRWVPTVSLAPVEKIGLSAGSSRLAAISPSLLVRCQVLSLVTPFGEYARSSAHSEQKPNRPAVFGPRAKGRQGRCCQLCHWPGAKTNKSDATNPDPLSLSLTGSLRTRCFASSRAGNVNVSWLAIPAGYRYRYRRRRQLGCSIEQSDGTGQHRHRARGCGSLLPCLFSRIYVVHRHPKDTRRDGQGTRVGEGKGGPSDQTRTVRIQYVHSRARIQPVRKVAVDHRPSRGQKPFARFQFSRELPRALCSLLSNRFSVCGLRSSLPPDLNWRSSGSAAVARANFRGRRERCALYRRLR
ncbi:hypothetical protein C8Q74DRAFT_534850 [Fomes fomentarius]|nr:hypothetical protein C8Q74DRAFT_534850 [Fomes fomentarius]